MISVSACTSIGKHSLNFLGMKVVDLKLNPVTGEFSYNPYYLCSVVTSHMYLYTSHFNGLGSHVNVLSEDKISIQLHKDMIFSVLFYLR